MQERVIGVARDLEEAIERRDAADDVREIPDAEPGRPARIADTWAGWAEPTLQGPDPQVPPQEPQAEELFTSSETVDLTFPEIPPLDLRWDDEDD
jgi:hypothetical protein